MTIVATSFLKGFVVKCFLCCKKNQGGWNTGQANNGKAKYLPRGGVFYRLLYSLGTSSSLKSRWGKGSTGSYWILPFPNAGLHELSAEAPLFLKPVKVFPVVYIKKIELERILLAPPLSTSPPKIEFWCVLYSKGPSSSPSQMNLRKQTCLL